MIRIRKGADRRVRAGHLWIFSNEIEDPPVGDLQPGSIHEVTDGAGEFVGMAYANPRSLIAARVLSRKRRDIDEEFFRSRFEAALERKTRLAASLDSDSYRLIFGEGDLVPGLVVDKYRDVLVIQALTAGIDAKIELIVSELVSLLQPAGVFLRNDVSARELEGLPKEKRLAHGSVPETVQVRLRGMEFLVDIVNGQKTGFYLDQEFNRALMDRHVREGAKVLDLFSYTGAWGIRAAKAGAGEVVAVDSSRGALNLAEANAELNGVAGVFSTVREPVLEFLKKSQDTWDLIVLDPPAFIKSRALVKEGIKGYIDINRRALLRLGSGGILVTCSCSHHLDEGSFEELIASASRQSGRELRILEKGGQGPDHPALLAMPETRYLKLMAVQVV
ncbi:MAG: class I SAM-dependent rRNA methyltransferase [Thermodesulfobacteriota bacterium]